jgi:hypothetical protein
MISMTREPDDGRPRPGRLRRWCKAIAWSAAWGVTLVVLVYAVENWLGARAWRAYVAEARAAGESLEPAAIIPPPVPDEENFAAIPLFQPLFDYERRAPSEATPTGELEWRDPAAKGRLDNLRPFAPGHLTPPGNWRNGEFADLAAWEKGEREKNSAAPGGVGAPGAKLLADLARFNPEMKALRAAASRPRSRFPIRYEDHVGAAVPHMGLMLNFARIAQARALAELSLGDTDAAEGNLLLGLRLAEATSEEPLLISHLVQIAQLELIVVPLWEGLVRHQWSEEELARTELALARVDLISGFQRAIRGERTLFAIQGLDALKKERWLGSVFVGFQGGGDAFALMCRLLPRGSIDFNKAYLGRYFDQLLHVADPGAHRFRPEVAVQLEQQLSTLAGQRLHPRKLLAAITAPAVAGALNRSVAMQATVDLARCAIALERHRLRHGALPETLEELAPAFLLLVRPDVASGQPLRFRRVAPDDFVLYSVGWNGRDDGGAFAWKGTPPRVDWRDGDWPWPRPTR